MARYNNQGLDHVAIAVSDLERSRRFYEEVLGLERIHEQWEVPIVLAANGSGLALFNRDLHTSPTPDDVGPPAVRILHVAFRVNRAGFDEAQEALAEQGIESRFSDHGLSHSLYFDDPDGHQIELTTYEV
jgi:catechol 2,3-dioxygenase-like lactoylglutathione lyase family enzyme